MVPSVTTGSEIMTASVPVPQFPSGSHGGIPLTSGQQDRLKDTLVKTIEKQLVLKLLVVLVAGTGIQLTKKGQNGKKRHQYQFEKDAGSRQSLKRYGKIRISNAKRGQFGKGHKMQEITCPQI